MPDIDLADRATYRHWSPVTIRFSDQDSLGHTDDCVSPPAISLSGQPPPTHPRNDKEVGCDLSIPRRFHPTNASLSECLPGRR